MAKRTRMSAGASARVSPRRYVYTPELLAHGRHRYEHTEDSIPDIAVEFGIHKTTLLRLARREGWVRYAAPPRDVSDATRLAAEAAALEAAAAEATAPPEPTPADAEPPSEIDRLLRAVRTELDVYEAMRARLKHQPQSPLDAERTARTLSNLTDTLYRLQRLRAGIPEALHDHDDDDMPADLDAFRDELARRIEAFMESRTDEEFAAELERAGADRPGP